MAKDEVNDTMVVIGGSAGSLEVILKIVPVLPIHTDATFVIVTHRRNDVDSILADLLSKKTSMVVKEVEDKEPIHANTIYLAPPDYHLLFEDTKNFSLDTSEKVHFSRPSIDVTFESAAQVFGTSVIGVLLSGANADGAAGMESIMKAGGFSIVQDPSSAEVDYMPQQAINRVKVNAIVEGDEIGGYLNKLLSR